MQERRDALSRTLPAPLKSLLMGRAQGLVIRSRQGGRSLR